MNATAAARIYVAMDGAYGLVWLLKDMAFPDPAWQRRTTIAGGLYTFAGLVLAWIWGTLFATDMAMKEASLSRYPGWAEYKRRSWWLVPYVL